MVCGNCGQQNIDGSLYCSSCSAALAVPQGQPGPPVGYAVAPRTSGYAIASLVCAIAGGSIVGLAGGIIFGYMALDEIKRSGDVVQGKGMALAGIWISFSLLALGGLAAIIFFVFFATVFGAATHAGPNIRLQ